MSLWTWGSNSNYLLGHTSSKVELVEFTKSFRFPVSLATLDSWDAQIQAVAMSKYHLCILTKDRLFTNGFGSGGRLGHGNQESCLFPTPVVIPAKIIAVSVGPDHTVALSDQGKLFSWGSNEHHVLGYPMDGNQLTPHEISTKTNIKGIACSKLHSACYTSSGSIYTWGTNLGQLGYNGKTQIQPKKITSFPQQEILQICATNHATAILSCDHVHVFSNGNVQRVVYTYFNLDSHRNQFLSRF